MKDLFEKKYKESASTEEEKVVVIDDKLAEENEQLKSKLLYLQADNENIRKNANKRIAETISNANSQLISALLEPLDDLDRAVDHLKDEGLSIAIKKLYKVLKENGLEEIPLVEFDSDLHEAVYNQTGNDTVEIIDCIQKGYKVNGKVVRHSKVIVG